MMATIDLPLDMPSCHPFMAESGQYRGTSTANFVAVDQYIFIHIYVLIK